MLGSRGAQFPSKTVLDEGDFRIDVENPKPGERAGQIHYQTGGQKLFYDPESGRFVGASRTLNRQLLSNPKVQSAIAKALKYLGEGQ